MRKCAYEKFRQYFSLNYIIWLQIKLSLNVCVGMIGVERMTNEREDSADFLFLVSEKIFLYLFDEHIYPPPFSCPVSC